MEVIGFSCLLVGGVGDVVACFAVRSNCVFLVT